MSAGLRSRVLTASCRSGSAPSTGTCRALPWLLARCTSLPQAVLRSSTAQRRLVLSAGMIACHGQVQREGTVVHVVTDRLEDLSDLLRSVGERDEAFPIRHDRGDGATHPGAPDPQDGPGAGPGGRLVRDNHIPDLRLGSGIKVPTRDFR